MNVPAFDVINIAWEPNWPRKEKLMHTLVELRNEIDRIDNELVALVARRLAVCRTVAELKKSDGIPMMQPTRVAEVKQRNAERGAQMGLDPNFTTTLYGHIIAEACRLEDEIIGRS